MRFATKEEYGEKIGIYRIRNLQNEFVYIGQTNESFVRRFWLHNSLLKNNKHNNCFLQSDYNLIGEDQFVFEPIIIVESKQDLDAYEKKFIKEARESGRCYNISDGGKGALGVPMTEENRKFHAEHNRILNTGKKASEETKRKMSEKRKGKHRGRAIMEKAIRTRNEKYLNGSSTKQSKINVEQVREIKQALMQGVKWSILAEKYGVSKSNINAIRSNRSWKFVEVEGWNEYIDQARQSRSAN
jgi:group I intron endonuclease